MRSAYMVCSLKAAGIDLCSQDSHYGDEVVKSS